MHRHAAEDPPALRRLGDAAPHDLDASASCVMSSPSCMIVPVARARIAADRHHQGGFAGAVGADQRDDLALLHRQVDAAQRLDRAVERGDAGQRQQRGHAGDLVFLALAEIGGDDGRVGAHLGRRAVADLLAVVQHDDVVGDPHHHAHVVLDQQQRAAVVADAQQQLVELVGLARVEAGGRFVQAQQHRVGAHRARDLQPPLRAIGQRAGGIVGARGQADRVQPDAAPFPCPPPRRRGSGPGRAPPARRSRWRAIRVLCCATSRFSSTVMPANRRIFWNVRATLARGGDAVAGHAIQREAAAVRHGSARCVPPVGR